MASYLEASSGEIGLETSSAVSTESVWTQFLRYGPEPRAVQVIRWKKNNSNLLLVVRHLLLLAWHLFLLASCYY